MRETGQLAPHLVLMLEIDFRKDEFRSIRRFGHDRSPGIDNKAMAVADPFLVDTAVLRGCEHVDLIFDGAGA